MFLTATKIAIVDALRGVWFEGNQDPNNPNLELTPTDEPYPRRITIEYPEEGEDWPFILVQVRPTVITWTGIMPDEVVDSGTEDAPVYKLIRQGRFEATCMLQIMANQSQTRDRIWDNLINVLLMGRKRNATHNFFSILEDNELVGLTIMEGTIRPLGDTISMGTPWDPEALQYEASLEFDIVGTFYADEYNQKLVPLKAAMIYDYIDIVEEPPFEEDTEMWSAHITEVINAVTDQVINVGLDDEIPDKLINGDRYVLIDNDEFRVLEHPWLATIGREAVMVIMVGENDKTLIRVNRAQQGTVPGKHKNGTLLKHWNNDEKTDMTWKTWMV